MSDKRGIVLVNLGSPDSTDEDAVRRYLHEFLMDKYVIDAPWPIRKFVVCATVLPTRPAESAKAYKKIWWEEGSPLKVLSARLADDLRGQVAEPLEMVMRYQNPSMESGILSLVRDQGVTDILLVPLYPHHAMSSVTTTVKEAERVLARHCPGVSMSVLPPFYDASAYIDGLVAAAAESLVDYDHLLFSFHGLPERHIHKADPTGSHCLKSATCCETASPAHATCYRHQCFRTAQEFVKSAGIPDGKWSVSFQSRLGRDPWLLPSTDQEVPRFAQSGVKRLAVICPAFVTDCLETLEEIAIRAREEFLEAGGDDLWLVPCMNTHPTWVKGLASMLSSAE